MNITVEGGSSVRLLTAGKYCDQDIIVTATGSGGGGGGGDDIIAAIMNGTVTEIVNADATTVRERFFQNCTNLVKVKLPSVTTFAEYAFSGCSALSDFQMPSGLISIGTNAFNGCSALKVTELPNTVAYLNTYAFNKCTSLETIVIPPGITTLNSYVFGGCTGLRFVDLKGATRLSANAFNGCSNLSRIVLRYNKVCTLNSSSVLTGTPFASGGSGGVVYVPSSLIESYQKATNWSTLYAAGTCNFVAIEGSEYE